LKECLTCDDVRRELDEVNSLVRADFTDLHAPQNSQALWLRIREQVESDMNWAQTTASHAKVKPSRVDAHKSMWSRLWNARWEVSAPQTAAFASLMLVAAMVTAFGLGVRRAPVGTETTAGVASNSFSLPQMNFVDGNNMAGVAPRQPSYEDYVRQQQAEAQYWMRQVETRKARFSPQLLDSYERSLASLDQTVAESLDELRRNPRDEFSVEILNHALREKAELLKEFSEF